MRLIDADELIKGRVENDPVRIAAGCAPTAFDKEKVIAKIDNASMSRCRYGFRNFDLSPRRCIDCQNDFIRAVYEIVEKGGIE